MKVQHAVWAILGTLVFVLACWNWGQSKRIEALESQGNSSISMEDVNEAVLASQMKSAEFLADKLFELKIADNDKLIRVEKLEGR